MRPTMILLAATIMMSLPCCAKTKWTDEMRASLKEMQNMYFWQNKVQWLDNHNAAEGYLRSIGDYSIPSLQSTRELLVEEQSKARVAKSVVDAICGKKKGKKRQEALAKYFTDMERANSIVEAVERINADASMLIGAIDYELKHRKPAVMPSGQLLSFSSSAGNGFAGWRQELTLERKKAGEGGKLTLNEERFRGMGPEDEGGPTSQTVEVADSVFQRVRDMVESGQLYDIGSNYMPDYFITDATSWSLYFKFEGGSISSSGYASGPDHGDALNEIQKYLVKIVKGDSLNEK